MEPVDDATARELGETLPDGPLTFDSRCLLLRGLGDAWVAGPVPSFRAAIIRDRSQPREPRAFGVDPLEIWSILRGIQGWDCVNCPTELAGPLADVLGREISLPTKRVADVYLVLEGPPVRYEHPWVRRLSEDDVELFDGAPEPLRPLGYSSTLAALSGGIVAGAVADKKLRGIVSMTASSETYANLAAHTLEPWRRQGIGTAATYLVAREAQLRGLDPVWSAGEDNPASLGVARKLGFQEVGRRAYVVVPGLQRIGGFHPPSDARDA
ncbi:MAG TPA: GNAT family N-acetyltransferase [Thermoplasmata archaeon]|nr:GNAT family N-acetyltransferase [Thermoplasmata archaeon]